ncbi:MAG TPA: MSMEG_0565 family glycosyltransferase [Arsenicitalea sp.]|jgi:glycosyltransferase-like protein|nr:MSMEG_0565 family glycosyltransferase [Arsenicitalea sp.]
MTRPLRIAMLAHSTNPRGGVVHALELSEALTALGHEVVLHAPDPQGRGFFRPTRCRTVSVAAGPALPDMTAMVEQRIVEYISHFEPEPARRFDLFHAHDGISGNALATLKQKGLIHGFVRTVHHIDDFADQRLMDLQKRSISAASVWACVGAEWQSILAAEHGVSASLVGNGVDRRRFSTEPDANDTRVRERLVLGLGPVFLVVGGVEARKNTIRILEAFVRVRAALPDAQLVIAGGASLLDHSGYRAGFDALLQTAGLSAAVQLTGPLSDAEMPALYRLATTLVFASVKEGFGLCVLEAMASGTPVIVPAIRPFTDYLGPDDALWCDPYQPGAIADAMVASLEPGLRRRLIASGRKLAPRHTWADVAARHLPLYHTLMEAADA